MKLPFMQFFPADWLMKTRPLTLAAKGGWIDILCYLHNAPERGCATMPLQGWARVIGASDADADAVIRELETSGVADVERDGNGDVTLISRRMRDEAVTREQTRLRVRRHRLKHEQATTDPMRNGHGNGHGNASCNADDTDRRQKTEDRSQKTEDPEKASPSMSPPNGSDPPEDELPFMPNGDQAAQKPPPQANPAVPFAEVMELYNSLCPSMPRASLTALRRKSIRARWLECIHAGNAPLAWFTNLFSKAEASDFLSGRRTGEKATNWRCTFDWLIGPKNAPKVIEGNYDNREAPKQKFRFNTEGDQPRT